MNSKIYMTIVASALLALGGCASTPDVTVGYYLPKSTLNLTVVRTVGCGESGRITVLSGVVGGVAFSRGEHKAISVKRLDDWFANTTTSLAFYGDGRLSGVNAEQAGQGGELIKTGLALAQAASPRSGGASFLGESADAYSKACEAIREVAGEKSGAPLTFTYSEDFSTGLGRRLMKVHPDSAELFDKTQLVLGLPCFDVLEAEKPSVPIWPNAKDTRLSNKVFIELVQPAEVKVAVMTQDLNLETSAKCDQQLWGSSVSVPQWGSPYSVPVLRPAPFGKQVFGMGLAESGALTSIKYGKDVGLISSIDAGTAVLGAGKSETESEEAARLKAQSDVIFQQQRLMKCQLDAAACTG